MLITEATEAFQLGHPFDTYEILNREFEIRQMRISEGIKFLSCTGNDTLAKRIKASLSTMDSFPDLSVFMSTAIDLSFSWNSSENLIWEQTPSYMVISNPHFFQDEKNNSSVSVCSIAFLIRSNFAVIFFFLGELSKSNFSS